MTTMIASMTAAQRGLKHICSDCACKFYDLGTKGALCPKCGGQRITAKLQASGRPVKRSARSNFGQYPQSRAGEPARSPAAERTTGDDAELSELEPKL